MTKQQQQQHVVDSTGVAEMTADGGAITCIAAGPDGCVFAGDASGTSICAIADPCATLAVQVGANATECSNVLLAVGSASGELVFFRNETEARRVQLESAVLAICAHGSDPEFLVGDLVGTLYGVNQYGVLWKERAGDDKDVQRSAPDAAVPAFFLPSALQPTVKAIASVRELDVEQTLSSYALVSTGQRHLLLTHRGHAFARIATPTPAIAIASLRAPPSAQSSDKVQRDVVLVAGDAGKVYQISTTREPTFRFAVDVFAEVYFPVAKLVAVDCSSSSDSSDEQALTWICLGENGQLALFHGREHVHAWTAPSRSNGATATVVDIAIVSDDTADRVRSGYKHLAVAYSDHMELLAVPLCSHK